MLVLHGVRGHTEGDALIAHWCHWLEQLPPAARDCWDTADSRTLDLGWASGHGGGAPLEVVLHPSRLAALAALGACLQVTVSPWPPG
ncbi:hypothetical protein CCO03_12760 [Comamonas serinivorans]|uniref:Uncharacterized protein n=1 Tax=Comamonas serinivorans TaxID=1082851 RepID=A0A1Y0EQB9_9BURK|nr:hypothetical protein CCO03_12760 [Comamonas serinivorans]